MIQHIMRKKVKIKTSGKFKKIGESGNKVDQKQ